MPIKSTTLTPLIGRRSATSGFQEAHLIGRAFYNNPVLDWIEPILSVDGPANLLLLPESERGSVILGVAAHFGSHNSAYDRFLYEANSDGKFLEQLRQNFLQDIEPLAPGSPEHAVIEVHYRNELLNFLDFMKVFFLYDEHLASAGLSSGNALHSLALNVSDPRFSTRPDVASYYEDDPTDGFSPIRQDLFDDASVRSHPLYQQIAGWRAAGEDVETMLVEAYPDLSRILYPDGEVLWATRQTDEFRAVHADVLSREAA